MKKINFVLLIILSASIFVFQNIVFAAATTEGRKDLLALGSQAPDFSLPEVTRGQSISLKDFDGKKAFVVMIICRHCPFVQHVKKEITKITNDYKADSVGFVGISANDSSVYPQDAPDSLKEMVEEENYSFPVLYDESQATAKAYTAVATPDFFVFDKDRKLVYRGQMDASRPGNAVPVTGENLRAAIDAVLHDSSVQVAQKPAVGCSIKWKKGNEPSYF